MGDCRLIFRIDPSLSKQDGPTTGIDDNKPLSAVAVAKSNVEQQHQQLQQPLCFSKVFSADTTIREVMDSTTLQDAASASAAPSSSAGLTKTPPAPAAAAAPTSLRSMMRGSMKARLWDCTVHPPRDISEWPLHEFSAIKGSKSKTLYDAGWYPSGTLLLLPPGMNPKVASLDMDVQFNLQAKPETTEKNPIPTTQQNSYSQQQQQWPRQKPSELLQAAKNRFSETKDKEQVVGTKTEADVPTSSCSDVPTSASLQRLRERREANRKRRLEACLQKLDHKAKAKSAAADRKNANVTAQLRRMLIKSRATGRTNLAVQDRVYFHFIFLVEEEDEVVDNTSKNSKDDNNDDDNNEKEEERHQEEEFGYFSRQDTIGHVLDSFHCCPKGKQVEFLIQTTTENSSSSPSNDGAGAGGGGYGKLTSLIRLYEAIDSGYLQQDGNEVVIRIFDPAHSEPTPVATIDPSTGLDPPENDTAAAAAAAAASSSRKENSSLLNPSSRCSQQQPQQQQDPPEREDPSSTYENCSNDDGFKNEWGKLEPTLSSDTVESLHTAISADSTRIDPSGSREGYEEDLEPAGRSTIVRNLVLLHAIRMAEQKDGKPKKTTKASVSAAARKVRQMQIKSKATGDEKRVKQQQNRFYFEAIVVTRSKRVYTVQSIRPHFLASTDKLSRLIRDYYSTVSFPNPEEENTAMVIKEWDYLILPESAPQDDDSVLLQRILDPDQSLKELEDQSLLKPFDKVILMAQNKNNHH